MKIEGIEIRRLELPYKKPLVTAANKFIQAEGLVVRVWSEDEIDGYGYVDLFPRTGETLGSAHYAIEKVLKPVLLNQNIRDLGAVRQEMNRVLINNPRAKSGVETALYDLLAKALKTPLYVQLGGKIRNAVRVIRMVGLDAPDKMAEEAAALTRKGFSALKLKVSGEAALDLDRVSKVRAAVDDKVFLKVDANEAYDAKTAVRLAKKLADLGVEVFEQPVRRFQLDALAEVKRLSPIKIEADQSVASAADAYLLIKRRAVDSINTSVMKAGGLFEAMKIADLCELTGTHCVLGNTAGSMLGDAAALQVAVSRAGVSFFAEIGEFETVEGDPFAGLKVEKGILQVPEAAGLGVHPQGSEPGA